MSEVFKRKLAIVTGSAMVLNIIVAVIGREEPLSGALAFTCAQLVIVGLYIWACHLLSIEKGLSPRWKWMGCLFFMGLIFLWCFPDKKLGGKDSP
jgi:4-amino-4-deoxy-L-arabinose transferase-like glycosyltransferase